MGLNAREVAFVMEQMTVVDNLDSSSPAKRAEAAEQLAPLIGSE